jgi:4-amino-4-deoxy-L-arabinose transferase-like glycosyltransferase/putative flippase GtrA
VLDVDVVVPVFNEEAALERSIRRLHRFLAAEFPFRWRIVIADNASTDATPAVAAALAATLPGVDVLRLERKGRGRALRAAWSASPARVVAYMDVDLSTDLRALLPLVAPLLSGHSELAIGTRLGNGSRVVRGPKRELISRAYNRLLHTALRVRFSDAQCGFKAVRRDVLDELLAGVADDGWFFDTELLVLAQRRGLRIHEVPVDWIDDPDSRVRIVRTAIDDLRGVARLAAASPVARFMAIGVVSTLLYALGYLLLRGPLGPGTANAVVLALTAIANTAANRRFTFGVRGRDRLLRHHAQGAVVFVLTLALTSGALLVLHALAPSPPRLVEVAVLIAASTMATVTRYVALKAWVFAHGRAGPRAPPLPRPGAPARGLLIPTTTNLPELSMSSTVLPRVGARPGRAGATARALVRGRPEDPRWVRPALVGVVALAAVLCLWNLTISGWSNTYYAAAVRAASESWTALFFGSLDPGSFITVDKPPLSLWLMGLSARVFGFSPFSMLLPQALCTIAAVGLLYSTVRRAFGPAAGLVAAAALAITPVTVAIARVNNPDALLVLLLVAAGWLLVRALESGRTRHLVLCGAVVGLAFMTKMLQGWMIVPALAAAYALAGPSRLAARIGQLALAGVAMVAVSAAWPVAVSLWPADSRPYIGGSTDGSVWDLILGYNGFGRLTGAEGGMGGGRGMGGGGFGGQSGLWRMLNEQVGGQIAWLLPVAAVGLAAGLWLTRSASRTDLRRAVWVLFGVWALVHVVVFSFAQGIFHPYYVSALAPAVAVLTGAGLVTLWRWARESWVGLVALDAAVVGAAWVAVELLGRTPDFAPWLRVAIPIAVAVAVFAAPALRMGGPRYALAVAAVAGALAIGAGPASYSVASVGRALNGNDVTAGPASADRGMGAGFGGGGASSSSSSELVSYLLANQGSAKYLVAASGSQTSASIIIGTGKPVVTIGGFNGGDPAPTVSQLEAMVASGELRYVLIGGERGGPGGGSSELTAWVQEHGEAVEGLSTQGATLYRVSA